jgi:putative glutamine amidotransferase
MRANLIGADKRMPHEHDYPFVGVSINIDSDHPNEQNIHESYTESLYQARCIPFIIPLPRIDLKGSYPALADKAIERLDGLLLTGGDDVDAKRYDEENLSFNGDFSEERDLFEIELCKSAARRKKPILGICRGIQLLNVAMGGTLFQDIERQNAGKKPIMHYQKAPSYSCVHYIKIEPGSQISRALQLSDESCETIAAGEDGFLSIQVNSFHHQGVKDVAPGFKVSAFASDGIVEAIEPKDGSDLNLHAFTVGVQWHPERMWKHHKTAKNLFLKFADVCKNSFAPS